MAMLETPATTTTPTHGGPDRTSASPAPRTRGDIGTRYAGMGALAFVGIVAAQNVIRGGSAPANDASADEVLTHYADHRGTTALLAALFVVGGASLAVFLGGVMRRMATGDRRGWAYTGYVGAIAVLSVFAVLVGTESALSVVANGDHPSTAAVEALWALHNSVFTVLFLFIGVALLGLGRAGVAAGVTPRVFDRLAPVGFVLLASAGAVGPFIAAGDAMPAFAVGACGFLIWLAFLATTGLRLVRSDDTTRPAQLTPAGR
jgi:hypothetical protein